MNWPDYREIQARVRLIDLLASMGWRASRRRGDQQRGPCLLPGCIQRIDRPSHSTFSLHGSRNIYRCFRCGSQGGVIDFWAAYRGQTIAAAAQELWMTRDHPNRK
jgi:hypothetical protein